VKFEWKINTMFLYDTLKYRENPKNRIENDNDNAFYVLKEKKTKKMKKKTQAYNSTRGREK
jgi:hypothetical protein